MNIGLGISISRPSFKRYGKSLNDFYKDHIINPKVKKKKEQHFFVATGDYDSLYKAKENLLPTARLSVVIDGDEPLEGKVMPTVKEVHEYFKGLGYSHIVYSSHGRGIDKSKGADEAVWFYDKSVIKFRVILDTVGVNQGNLDATTRYIVDEMNNAGLNVAYAHENNVVVNAWFFGGVKYLDLFESYIYTEGKAYKGLEVSSLEAKKAMEGHTERQAQTKRKVEAKGSGKKKSKGSNMITVLETGIPFKGGRKYHKMQTDFAWMMTSKESPLSETMIETLLYAYLNQWKGSQAYLDDIDRWQTRWDEVKECVSSATAVRVAKSGIGRLIDVNTPFFSLENKRIKQTLESIDKGDEKGLGSHLPELDEITGGFRKKELIVLGGRSGKGKTTLALNFASHIADEHNVLFFSAEMPAVDLIKKIAMGEVDDGKDMVQVRQVVETLGYKKLEIIDSKQISIEDIVGITKMINKKNKIDFVVIDYLQRFAIHKGNADDSTKDFCNQLTALMVDEDLPILLVSQFRKLSGQDAKSKRPNIHDLTGSGQIGYDANMILLMHKTDKGQDKIIVEKNRLGAEGEIQVDFDGAHSMVKSLSYTKEAISARKESEEIALLNEVLGE